MDLLRAAVEESTQAAVARRLGYSSSHVSLALKGSKQHHTTTFMQRVVDVFGKQQINCPVLGDISPQRCCGERKREFSTANPLRVELWVKCKKCEHNPTQNTD